MTTRPTYVYLASSWRNPLQPAVSAVLTAAGIDHYDFRNPEGGTGFAWSEIDPDWRPVARASRGQGGHEQAQMNVTPIARRTSRPRRRAS